MNNLNDDFINEYMEENKHYYLIEKNSFLCKPLKKTKLKKINKDDYFKEHGCGPFIFDCLSDAENVSKMLLTLKEFIKKCEWLGMTESEAFDVVINAI